MSSGGGFSGGGGGYSGGFGPPMGGFGGGFGPPMGGFGQQFGGFQPPQYGGGFGQPFGGGFQQPQYGGGFGFQQPQFGGFQNQGPGNAYARQNPYQPPTPPQSPNQPPPGMELNPDYIPPRIGGADTMEQRPSRFRPIQQGGQQSNRLSQDMRLGDWFSIEGGPRNFDLDTVRRLSENPPLGFAERLGGSPQGARPNPATGVMPSEPISPPDEGRQSLTVVTPAIKDGMSGYYTDSSMNRFVPDEPQAQQGFGFGNPYGGYGAPYGGSPYMGMFGGLGSLFGGNGFQGMNQQARAQQMALENQRQFPQGSFNPTSANANTMTQSYKNPNYDPNNPDSQRYITIY